MYDVYSPMRKEPLLFTRDVYVMISNKTYSCSVYATTILKDNGIAKVIGEPSGENPAFNRHGSGSDGKLPEVGWPFMMTSHKGSRPMDHDISEIAIFPDIPVYTTRQDLIAGRGIQMEIMRQISHGQYDYVKEHITVGIEDKIINLDNLPSKIHEQNFP